MSVDGRPVRTRQKRVYIMLNKPAGYITSRSQRGRKIVFDLVEVDERLNPVGRLDKDSTGSLLLTNDGALHHRLIHPSFDHEKRPCRGNGGPDRR
ncbi:MAG: pseudouridine synthase [Desulfobacterales bacterium]